MILARVGPDGVQSVDTDSSSAEAFLADEYVWPDAPWVRLNMLTGLTGSAVGADGTSDTLTSRVDRRILAVIRRGADVIVVGAETVRVEGYTVPEGGPVLAVVTASGDLDGARFGEAPAGRVLLVCPGGRADAVRARRLGFEVVPVGDGDRVDPPAALDALHRRGLHRIVCEGGPALASEWSDAGLIDEYCVTVAPALGAEHPSFLRLATPPVTAVAGSIAAADGFSFLRLRRAR